MLLSGMLYPFDKGEKMEETTIAAISTAMSASGIGIVRDQWPGGFLRSHPEYTVPRVEKSLKNVPSHTIHYGYIYDNEETW